MPKPELTSRIALLALTITLILAAVGPDSASASALNPDPALRQTAAAIFPTTLPTLTPTPTPLARADDGEAIARLLDAMQIAVLARRPDAYLALVDLSDPVFALEHTRWVEDWTTVGVTVTRFELAVRNLVVEGDTASGDLNMLWTVRLSGTDSDDGEYAHGADFPAIFTRSDGGWRYAGERFETIEGEHFRVRYVPGLEEMAAEVAAMTVETYPHVTDSLGYTPEEVVEIKLYDEPWAMLATIRFSMPSAINGWNEPGEALKLLADDLPRQSTLAHEFTHFICFEVAGRARGQMPWWLAEGIAMVVASEYWTFSDRSNYLALSQEWQRMDGLVPWEDLSNFEETPTDLWPHTYAQGYAFTRFVTETYGPEQRNSWLAAMTDQSIDEASREALGLPFADLSAAFLDWLPEQ